MIFYCGPGINLRNDSDEDRMNLLQYEDVDKNVKSKLHKLKIMSHLMFSDDYYREFIIKRFNWIIKCSCSPNV